MLELIEIEEEYFRKERVKVRVVLKYVYEFFLNVWLNYELYLYREKFKKFNEKLYFEG